MTDFRVDPETLDELAGELRRRRDRLTELRDGLAGEARALAAEWEGAARDEFVGTHSTWSRDVGDRAEALAAAAELAESAASTYREVDRAVGEMFS
jgi:WXG100 family type VII secretion target